MSAHAFDVVHNLDHASSANQAEAPRPKTLRTPAPVVRGLDEGRAWAAAALVETRRELGVSRRWIALWTGVDERLVRKWEKSETPLSVAALLAFPARVRTAYGVKLRAKMGMAA